MTPDDLAKSDTEHGHQRALFHWANMAYMHGFRVADNPEAYAGVDTAMHFEYEYSRTFTDPQPLHLNMMFAIPNGGLRDKITAGKLKAEGVKAGVLDILLPVPMRHITAKYGALCGLFIEMKDPTRRNHKNQGMSLDQCTFAANVTELGYRAVTCFTWREAANQIKRYYGMEG